MTLTGKQKKNWPVSVWTFLKWADPKKKKTKNRMMDFTETYIYI